MVKHDDIMLHQQCLFVPYIDVEFRIGLVEIMKRYAFNVLQMGDQLGIYMRLLKCRMSEKDENVLHGKYRTLKSADRSAAQHHNVQF
jgi:hypothetical protein